MLGKHLYQLSYIRSHLNAFWDSVLLQAIPEQTVLPSHCEHPHAKLFLNPQLSFLSCVIFSSCVHASSRMPLKASPDNSSPLYLPSMELSVYRFVLWSHVPYVIVLLLPLSFPSVSKGRLYTIHLGLLALPPPHHSPLPHSLNFVCCSGQSRHLQELRASFPTFLPVMFSQPWYLLIASDQMLHLCHCFWPQPPYKVVPSLLSPLYTNASVWGASNSLRLDIIFY